MIANTANAQQKQQVVGFQLPIQLLPVYGGQVIFSAPTEQKINNGTAVIGAIDKNNRCHLCQKDFSSLASLQSHLRQHVDDKGTVYRNIIVSSINNPVTATMISTPMIQHYHIANNALKIEKDYQPAKNHQTVIHTSDVIKQTHPEYTTVANLSAAHPVIQHIQIQQRDKEKSNMVQVVKQNPVEYHIQQQEHAAMVVASMNQKSGLTSPFLNSTIKYELHGQPVQLVTEVYPQIVAETTKSDDMNSDASSPTSPNIEQTTTPTPSASSSTGEAQNEKQHKCLLCDKYFSSVGNLNIHLKIHSGEKPYSKFRDNIFF